MAQEQRASGADEATRQQDGGGHRQPARGGKGDRGNQEPETAGSGTVVHVAHTIQGPDGPIEIVEDSGVAAAEVMREE